MDYKAKIKERMSKLLFLEMNKDGFKENIGIPSYVTFKNKDLYFKNAFLVWEYFYLQKSSEYLVLDEKLEYLFENFDYTFFPCLHNV